MKWLLLAFSISLSAADAPEKQAMPITGCPLGAFGIQIKAEDVMVTKKKGYVHILVDLFPYHKILKAPDDAQLQTLALAAVKDCAAGKHAAILKMKIDVVEFKERDEYGAPRWSSVKVLGKFEALKKKGQWKISRR